jgi:Secretion system C-terminal sorting domain
MMKILHKLPLLATLFFGLFFTSKVNAIPIVIYVDSAVVGGAHDGTSWANAFTSFQDGIDAAVAGNVVWVAKGSYQPSLGNSFSMKSGVKIFGGFANTATDFSERNPGMNPVILYGNNESVISNANVDADAALDGFTITGGNAPVFGGGINNNTTSATFTNLVITGNVAAGSGGGVFNTGASSVVFINVVISANNGDEGGGMANLNTDVTLTNVTFSGNSSVGGAGGFVSFNTSGAITNCLFWGNTGATPDISNSGTPVPDITYCFTQTFVAGTGNITGNFNPFVNDTNPAGEDDIYMSSDDGLQLLPCSAAINSGIDSTNTATTDIAGQVRFFNTSTIDIGAYEYQGGPENFTLATNADTLKQAISTSNNFFTPHSCRIIGELFPNGGEPVTDSVTFRVWVDNTVQSYNGQPYAQRHYDIIPETSPATATARVILHFTQAEFDAYNTLSTIDLPANPNDSTGIANMRILQFHGTSATAAPGTYSGSTEIIDPADIDVTWNTTINDWQVAFNVNGFSGFFVTSDAAMTLPLRLLSFTGQLANGKTLLQWKTDNEINTKHFDVEESSDGVNFSLLATVMANGTGNNNYSTIDAQTKTGNNYYRLKSVDNDGRFTYSNIVLIKVNSNGKAAFFLYPNPAAKQLTVQYDNANSRAQISIYNLQGQKVVTTVVTGSTQTTIDVSQLTVGTYMIEYRSDTEVWRDKFVKVN